MAQRPARPAKHKATKPQTPKHSHRHRAPTTLQRTRDRVGRPIAVATATGGVLAAATVIGSQALAEDRHPTTSPVPQVSVRHSSAGDVAERASRDADRPSLAQLKRQALHQRAAASDRGSGPVKVATAQLADPDADPRDIALAMLPRYGWSASEFSCLDQLWVSESDWRTDATNPVTGAYGIPQALPPEKMAAAGPDWRTNPVTQIEWGLGYIRDSYGTPCSANAFKIANGWY